MRDTLAAIKLADSLIDLLQNQKTSLHFFQRGVSVGQFVNDLVQLIFQ